MSEEQERVCFVIMPIGKHSPCVSERDSYDYWLDVFDNIIVPAVENSGHGVKCRRADRETRAGVMDDDIIESLLESFLCVADVTGKNPNVYYELGLRDSWHDRTIIITQNFDDVAFDKGHYRALLYTPKNDKMLRQFDEHMKQAIAEIVSNPDKLRNPVRKFLSGYRRPVSKTVELQWKSQAPSQFQNKLYQVLNALGLEPHLGLKHSGCLTPYRHFRSEKGELDLVFTDTVTDVRALAVQSRLGEGIRSFLSKAGANTVAPFRSIVILIPVDGELHNRDTFLAALEGTKRRNTPLRRSSTSSVRDWKTYEELMHEAEFLVLDTSEMEKTVKKLTGDHS